MSVQTEQSLVGDDTQILVLILIMETPKNEVVDEGVLSLKRMVA